jgi:hypothetical protein
LSTHHYFPLPWVTTCLFLHISFYLPLFVFAASKTDKEIEKSFNASRCHVLFAAFFSIFLFFCSVVDALLEL